RSSILGLTVRGLGNAQRRGARRACTVARNHHANRLDEAPKSARAASVGRREPSAPGSLPPLLGADRPHSGAPWAISPTFAPFARPADVGLPVVLPIAGAVGERAKP